MAYLHDLSNFALAPLANAERIEREQVILREENIRRQRQDHMAEELGFQAVEDFSIDHLHHMEHMERQTVPDVASIDVQSEIQWFMRPHLLNFLTEAHLAFGLLQETLFLSINILDRYCSKRVVYKKHYQLVGCAALLIASKYGDKKDRVPLIKELKGVCGSLYEEDMFTQMEWHVLQTLDWVIGHPTIDAFVKLALVNSEYDYEVEYMTWYISENALFHREFVSKLPSDMARASLALARCVLSRPQPRYSDWAAQYDSRTLISLSGHLHTPSPTLARKYASNHFLRVSCLLEEFLARQAASKTPPSPPREDPSTPNKKPDPDNALYLTPTKSQCHSSTAHGYMTPPITPTYGYGNSQNVSVGMSFSPCNSSTFGVQPPLMHSSHHFGCYRLSSVINQ